MLALLKKFMDLKKLAGVGDKTKAHLVAANIHTIEDLAKADVTKLQHVKNIGLHISHAQAYLRPKETKDNDSRATPNDAEAKTFKWLLVDHSWYEKRVDVIYEGRRREAIVYDLSVEPCERVAVVCSWVLENGEVCTSSFSLPFVAALNGHLPLFKLKVHPHDAKEWKNYHTLENSIEEANTLLNTEL